MICTNVKLLGLLPNTEWLNDTFRSGEPLTGLNGVLFKIGKAQRPPRGPLFPKCCTGPSCEYIWTPHNQNRALAAVNEARQVAERGAGETDAKREPQMPSLFKFFTDGFSNYRNSNLL